MNYWLSLIRWYCSDDNVAFSVNCDKSFVVMLAKSAEYKIAGLVQNVSKLTKLVWLCRLFI